MKSWDIFCHVVDNYGDIGVTWRLARQLSAEYKQSVRLLVDDLGAFRHLCPQVNPLSQTQQVEGVEIVQWQPQLHVEPADIVIEAFACELPQHIKIAMAERSPASLWINLEYLSAEAWVEGCHLLPSPQLCGPSKYFYFPGFTNNTGGLLREQTLLQQRQQFDAEQQRRFLLSLGVSRAPSSMLVSLFTYENPHIDSWLNTLAEGEQHYQLLVPPGRIVADIARWLNIDTLESGNSYSRGQVTIQAIPFVTQQAYDSLLWSCDLNLVRGEDSFVRAQWAGKPFLWHIYQQQDDIHLDKLNAFLDRYLHSANPATAVAVRQFWLNWNTQKNLAPSWSAWQQHSKNLQRHAENWCAALSEQQSLAEKLCTFVRNC